MGTGKKSLWKKILLAASVTFIIFIIAAEILLRVVVRINPQNQSGFYCQPNNFFQRDSALGWKNGAGSYAVYLSDSTKLFAFQVTDKGTRFTAAHDTALPTGTRGGIYLFGCSYTFGFCVADSSTGSYQLQQMLPGVKVVNKGVPAYGLAQMYLSLKQTLLSGDTPQVAIFNYSDFHDLRTPLTRQWGCAMRQSIPEGNESNFEDWVLPYFEYKNSALTLHTSPFRQFAKPWPLSQTSAFMYMLNFVYYSYWDGENAAYRHRISHQTAIEIMEYCKANGIVPVFAYILNSNDVNTLKGDAKPMTDIQEDLAQKGYYTLEYGIDISQSKYKRYGHPNELAHTIFAKKIRELLVKNKLVPLDVSN